MDACAGGGGSGLISGLDERKRRFMVESRKVVCVQATLGWRKGIHPLGMVYADEAASSGAPFVCRTGRPLEHVPLHNTVEFGREDARVKRRWY